MYVYNEDFILYIVSYHEESIDVLHKVMTAVTFSLGRKYGVAGRQEETTGVGMGLCVAKQDELEM
jgi:hypothetical protein